MKIDKLKTNEDTQMQEEPKSNANDIILKLIKECTDPVTGEMDVEKFKIELDKQIEVFEKLVKDPEVDDNLRSIASSVISINKTEKEQKNQIDKSDKNILESLVQIKDQDNHIKALKKTLHNVGAFLDFQTIFKFAAKNDYLRKQFNLIERYSKLDVYSTDLDKCDDDLLTEVEYNISNRIKKVKEMEGRFFSLNHNGKNVSSTDEVSTIKTSDTAPFLDLKDNQLTLVDLNDGCIIEKFKLSNNLLSALIVDKYFYGLTSYRMSYKLNLIGIDINLKDIDDAFKFVAEKFSVVSDAIRVALLQEGSVVLSQTPIEVLSSIKNKRIGKAWMVCLTCPSNNKRAVHYIYRKKMKSPTPLNEIKDYQGLVSSDWMRSYLSNEDNRFQVSLECDYIKIAFENCLKMDECTKGSNIELTSKRIIRIINKIEFIDKSLRIKIKNKEIQCEDYLEEDFLRDRLSESMIQFKKLRLVAEGRLSYHLQEDRVSVLLNYILTNYDLLLNYLDHIDLAPYSMQSNNIIKTFNETKLSNLFCEEDVDATNLAIIESVIESANLSDLDMVKYVTYLLDAITAGKLNEMTAKSYVPFNLSDEIKESLKREEDINKLARTIN
jgi:hypothetical protein